MAETDNRDRKFQDFINRHVTILDPLNAQMGRAYYAAQVSGHKQDYEKVRTLQLQINDLYMNKDYFQYLKSLKKAGSVTDLRQKRQLEWLYRKFLYSQMDDDLLKESINLQITTTERYNNYRGTIDGQPTTMTEIYRIMTQEKDVMLRQKAWKAAKQVGPAIVDDYLKLVKMRNRLAKQVGYDDYRAYSIDMAEQSLEQLDAIFDELAEQTAAPFTRLKNELDGILAADYGIAIDALQPWHYHDPFFQRTPLVYEINLDSYYADHDVAQLCIDYFSGIGLPVDDIMSRSDLYDKPGKNPHAFAMDVDRHGDVRILANIVNNERWAETTLHELGHAIYCKYHDPNEPYLLRQPAHAFTTEAAAMFSGRLSRNPNWMQSMLGLTDPQRAELEEVTGKYLRFQQLLFARWTLVMYHFEKYVYADPDQDLNTLWWDMVRRYQSVNRPDGPLDAGWASKLHFTAAPCYYHNYMLGELLVSQWYHYIRQHILNGSKNTSFTDDPRIGAYFKDNVFGPGAVYHWDEMIRRSTGQSLTVSFFLQQFLE